MSQSKEEPFLDDVEQAEAEEQAAMTEEAPESLDDQLDAMRAERDAFQDKFMRALADAENARKRAQKDRMEAENYGGSKLARDILPVFDNLHRAIESVTEEQRKEDHHERGWIQASVLGGGQQRDQRLERSRQRPVRHQHGRTLSLAQRGHFDDHLPLPRFFHRPSELDEPRSRHPSGQHEGVRRRPEVPQSRELLEPVTDLAGRVGRSL